MRKKPHPFSTTLVAVLFSPAFALLAQTQFVPAPGGCSMAHCETRINSLVSATAPTPPNVAILSHDRLPVGKGIGLGCSSNKTIAACSYEDPSGNNLVIYNSSGARMWASGSLLNKQAFASAPMIDASGDVIAADNLRVVRVTSTGTIVWNTTTKGGIPISPVITQSGAVVLATKGGPISAYNNTTGALIGTKYLRPTPGSPNYFETANTPCVNGNRIYISMQLSSDEGAGEMVAVDVNASSTTPFSVAWTFPFGGPSGASPVCVGNSVFFDGTSLNQDGPSSPVIFGLQDTGSAPVLQWVQNVPAPVPAALALDPRGNGLWCIYLNNPVVDRRTLGTGTINASINVADLVGDPLPNNPYSEINIAGNASDPVMLLGTTSKTQTFYLKEHPDLEPSSTFSSYVIAIDLNTNSLLWKLNLSPSLGSDSAASQFAVILNSSGQPEVVFAGNKSGAYFVGAP